jgi:hypothetical protein
MRANHPCPRALRPALQTRAGNWRSPAGATHSEHGKETILESVGIKDLAMDQSLGEIAYGAYCEAVSYQSVRGETLPNWEDQSEELQKAWDVAGEAVADYLEKS